MRCSLIIPAYNAEATLALCLESALNQSLPKAEYEVIIVDDGSTDATPEIAANYNVRLITQHNQGPAAARNRGAEAATGEVLVFTDSDCELDREFLDNITTPIIDDPDTVGVQGSYKTRQTKFMPRFCQTEIETRYRLMSKKERIDFIGTYAAAYRRDVFLQHGGFETAFTTASGEDAEFSYNLSKHRYKMIFVPRAFVYHKHPSTLTSYLKIKFYRGYWRVLLYKKHPKKAIKDSYTPQSLKLQVLGVPLLLLFGILSIFNAAWLAPFFITAASYLLFSLPFMRLLNERMFSAYIPAILFLRASSLLLGMLFGTIRELQTYGKAKLRSLTL